MTESKQQLKAMIRTFDDPALSAPCEDLRQGEDLSFLQLMRRVCVAADGQGLAAPQLGILKRAVFLRPCGVGYGEFMLNPGILDKSIETTLSMGEGCLSYPGERTDVLRAAAVKVIYLTKDWVPTVRTLTGIDAIVAQHEIDHLDGVCRVGDAWRRHRPARRSVVAAAV
jgi:peptide deformylase